MSVLIKGGRVVTAADDYLGDVFTDNGTVSLIGQSLDVAAGKTIDATGKLRAAGRDRPAYADRLPFGGTVTCDDFTSGTVSAAFGGTTSLVDFCFQMPGADLRAGARGVAREGRPLQAGDRRRLPHGDHRPARGRHARGPREGAGRGRHVATSCSWPTRARSWSTTRRSSRRWRSPRDRRPGDGARRERRRDRHPRQAGARGGAHGAGLARAHAPARDRGRGDEPRDPARARRRRAAVRRPRLLQGGDRADRDRAREGLERARRDVHAVPLHRRDGARQAGLRGREVHLHAAAAAEGEPGAPLEGACDRRALRRLDRPLPVQLAGAEGPRPRRLLEDPERRAGDREPAAHAAHFGVREGRISINRFVELISTNAGEATSASTRARARSRRAPTPTSSSGIPRRSYTVSASTHHSNVELQPVRGHAR